MTTVKKGSLLKSKLFQDGKIIQCIAIENELIWFKGEAKGEIAWSIKREDFPKSSWQICGFRKL